MKATAVVIPNHKCRRRQLNMEPGRTGYTITQKRAMTAESKHSILGFSTDGKEYQATAAVAGAAGTLGVATGSAAAATAAAAGVVAASVTVPLTALEVQSRDMCPAIPHL